MYLRRESSLLIYFLDKVFRVLDVAFCLEGLDDLVFEGGRLD